MQIGIAWICQMRGELGDAYDEVKSAQATREVKWLYQDVSTDDATGVSRTKGRVQVDESGKRHHIRRRTAQVSGHAEIVFVLKRLCRKKAKHACLLAAIAVCLPFAPLCSCTWLYLYASRVRYMP